MNQESHHESWWLSFKPENNYQPKILKVLKMAKSKSTTAKVGADVTYNPNGQDLSIRPKHQSMPAKIVSIGERVLYPGQENEKTIEVVNLIVFHDADPGSVRKVKVPHKNDAPEGVSFWE